MSDKKSFAQGTFGCEYIGNEYGYFCQLKFNNCAPNFVPLACDVWSGQMENCPSSAPCISSGTAQECTIRPPGHACPSEFPAECRTQSYCCKEVKNCTDIEKATPSTSLDVTCRVEQDPQGGIRTALGCIPANDLTSFVGWLLGVIVPIAAGIAFLLMAFGAFQIITSAGDPKKVQAGQELITSALSGLLFIILALFLLKLIGVDILRIPDFAKPFG